MKDFGLFQTAHRKMIDLLEAASSLSQSGASILVTGEQGSGKSLFVQYLTSLPAGRGNVLKWKEQIEASHDDWVVIEGIDELNYFQQTELSQKIEAYKQRNINIRWVATATMSPAELLRQNKIKRDLFYKISVLQMEIPSLRHRKEDIEVLAHFFIQVFSLMRSQRPCDLSAAALAKLLQHTWPGNVAELENVIERAVALNRNQIISAECIQFTFQNMSAIAEVGMTLSEMERKLILQTLQMTQQNKTKAAQILGISIRTLRNKLNEYREVGVYESL